MIVLANLEDLLEIKKFIDIIREELLEEENPQWQEDYPNEEIILNDINNNYQYLYKDNNIIKGIISITDDFGEYKNLIKNTSLKPAYIVHRLAVKKEFRNENIASKLLEFAEKKARIDNIKVLKSDTEKCNHKMIKLFKKFGYKYVSNFCYDDYPGSYEYFEKLV